MKISSLGTWLHHPAHPLVVAGPCSAESESQMLMTARKLKEIEGVRIFRAGIWKPRTRPNCFEGVGVEGLSWLEKVKKETGLLTATEVANAKHVELALKYNVDVLWIGARTTVSPFSVQEIADALRGVNIPVMVKNPINADLALWIGAFERFFNSGIDKLVAIHRGFSESGVGEYRNSPNWSIPIGLKKMFPELPMICDPSHITGRRDLVEKVCQHAIDLNFEGLMVESHYDPSIALSDAAQQVTPERLHEILLNLEFHSLNAIEGNRDMELEILKRKTSRIDKEIAEFLLIRQKTLQEINAVEIEMLKDSMQKEIEGLSLSKQTKNISA